MPWSGNGVFTRLYSWAADAAASIRIRSDRMDDEFANYKGGLENCLTRTGETTPLANTSWANFKLTNLANATNGQDAVNTRSLQGGSYLWGGTSTGAANVYVSTFTPAITSYTTGMEVRFKAHQGNTGTATYQIDALAAKTLKRASGTTLASGDIPNGAVVSAIYDGTDFRLGAIYSASTAADTQSGSVFWGGTSTGAANVYVISLTPALAAYTTGLAVSFLTHQANAAAATLNIDGLGAKSIFEADGTALNAGELPNGTVAHVIYDGTNFRLQSPSVLDRAVTWDTKVAAQTQGDLPYYGTSGLPARLAAGTVGHVLRTLGSGNNLLWFSPLNVALLTTLGSGIWVVPGGVTVIKVTCVGGGGGGYGPAGGGGGGASMLWITGLTPGASLAYTVGAGGTGGSTNGSGSGAIAATGGGTSSFSTFCTGIGGGAATNGVAGIGGAATNGLVTIRGGNGTASFGGGSGGTVGGSAGGDSIFGRGSNVINAVSFGYGAGGAPNSGAVNAHLNSIGNQGCILIEY